MIIPGTIVTCPNCNTELYSINTMMIDGVSTFYAEYFDPIGDAPKPQNGVDEMTCYICNSYFFIDGLIHTKDGWNPDDPDYE